MTNDDELRDRIARIDPSPDGLPTEPITSPRARALLESIMTTPLLTEQPAQQAPPQPARSPRRPSPKRWLGAAAAVVGLTGAGFGIAATTTGVFTADAPVEKPQPEPTVMELSTGDTDPSLMSCMMLTPEAIAVSPVAFRAVVDSVAGDVVTLAVDTWYAGGDADIVTLTAPQGMEALIGGLEFQAGQAYLVTAFDGVVSYCGQTGPATPELQAMFDAAFPA
ncbi:MAG TPA: hypothetical protein VNQ73_18335 [Ilumatobacter sp.]|nr:hypothetical protein [Ilumatobacter sp.]